MNLIIFFCCFVDIVFILFCILGNKIVIKTIINKKYITKLLTLSDDDKKIIYFKVQDIVKYVISEKEIEFICSSKQTYYILCYRKSAGELVEFSTDKYMYSKKNKTNIFKLWKYFFCGIILVFLNIVYNCNYFDNIYIKILGLFVFFILIIAIINENNSYNSAKLLVEKI